MQFVQRRFSTRITFNFYDDILRYTIKDSNGSSSYKFKYEVIDIKNGSEVSIKNSWFRNIGIISVLFGFAQIYSQYLLTSTFVFPFWVLIGFSLLVIYQINVKQYKVYPTDNGNVYIIRNKDYDRIFDELKARRNKKLKEQYFEIDFRNGMENEIAKYKWLEDENVITSEECKKKITELKIKYLSSGFSVN